MSEITDQYAADGAWLIGQLRGFVDTAEINGEQKIELSVAEAKKMLSRIDSNIARRRRQEGETVAKAGMVKNPAAEGLVVDGVVDLDNGWTKTTKMERWRSIDDMLDQAKPCWSMTPLVR